jgi:hypothetical protein
MADRPSFIGSKNSPTMPTRYAEKVLPRRGAVTRFYDGRRD